MDQQATTQTAAQLAAIRAENLRLAARACEAGVSPARFEGWVVGGTEDGYAIYSNVVLG